MTPFDPFSVTISKKKMAQKTEKRLAKRLGGFAQPNSGAISGFKGDVKLAEFLIDSKETDNVSYSVTLDTLTKIMKEADGMARHPALVIRIRKQSWACLPLGVFESMLKVWNERREE